LYLLAFTWLLQRSRISLWRLLVNVVSAILPATLEGRLISLFVLGLVLGGQVNRGIYRLAWLQRPIGPWSARPAEAGPGFWFDRLPVIGWWFLRRDAGIHGRLFWLRPLLLELALGLAFAWLYWYEVHCESVVTYPGFAPSSWALHCQYFSHLALISLMAVATFIDFDEQTIPDAIVIPGACLGLLIAGLWPDSRLPVTNPAIPASDVAPLHLASATAAPGHDWPGWLNGPWGLALGLTAYLAWWLAVLPWTWTTRRGLGRAVKYFCASLLRRTSWLMVAVAIIGVVAIPIGWGMGRANWESLLSALVGMTAGGAFVWAFRIVGTRALGQEAMGFGDVTLMAMIGAFTGWQATLMIFFLAPAAGLVIALSQWLLTGRKDIAFGPYLCLATVFLILRWGWIWEHYAQTIFSMGRLVPALVVVCLALSWALLTLMRVARGDGDG
jgi:leader peptidase (prepilin peptidase)/N-methyltransferase